MEYLGRDDTILCHKCWNLMTFDEIEWYEPMTKTVMPAFYKEFGPEPGYICPVCDAPLDSKNLAEFERWKQHAGRQRKGRSDR